MCVCVCVCRQTSLSSIIHLWRLFNSRRSPGSLFLPLMSRSAQPNFLSRPFFFSTSLFRPFHPMSAFVSCLKPFILSYTDPPTTTTTTTTTTTINPHPPPSLPSPSLSHLYSGLTSNGCVSPPFSRFLIQPSKLCSAIAHPTTQSPLMSGKPVGIRVLLLIISFTGNPHRPRCASGWRGEGEGERMKGRTEWSCVKSGWHVQPGSCCMRRRAKVAHAALSDER